MTNKQQASSTDRVAPLKLKIELKDMPHKVIRKVLVPGDINMWQLHLVIQEVMPWQHAHLFRFSDKKWDNEVAVEMQYDDGLDLFGKGDTKSYAPHEAGLRDIFYDKLEAKPFWYWYDFGDDWWHRISFQKVSKKDGKLWNGRPLVLEAIGKCPPEDVGGVWGYEDFLLAINDPKHPEYSDFREWMEMPKSAKYSTELPANVVEMMNKDLKKIYNHNIWQEM